MSKYCGKCGSKLSKYGFCTNCDKSEILKEKMRFAVAVGLVILSVGIICCIVKPCMPESAETIQPGKTETERVSPEENAATMEIIETQDQLYEETDKEIITREEIFLYDVLEGLSPAAAQAFLHEAESQMEWEREDTYIKNTWYLVDIDSDGELELLHNFNGGEYAYSFYDYEDDILNTRCAASLGMGSGGYYAYTGIAFYQNDPYMFTYVERGETGGEDNSVDREYIIYDQLTNRPIKTFFHEHESNAFPDKYYIDDTVVSEARYKSELAKYEGLDGKKGAMGTEFLTAQLRCNAEQGTNEET